MVAAAVGSGSARRYLWWAAAAGAMGYLLIMASFGTRPPDKQLVKFEAKGLLAIAPESVHSVAVRIGQQQVSLERDGQGGWKNAGTGAPLGKEAARQLDLAVKIMHTSNPIRELTAAELQGTPLSDFGLERPHLSITLSDERGEVLAFTLGTANPQNLLQYLQVKGSSSVHLMSGFIGSEWDKVASALGTP